MHRRQRIARNQAAAKKFIANQRRKFERMKSPMRHAIEVSIKIVAHDNNSLLAGPENPQGPVVAMKQVNFWGMGSNFSDVVSDVQAKTIAFLNSDGAKIGTGAEESNIIIPGPKPVE